MNVEAVAHRIVVKPDPIETEREVKGTQSKLIIVQDEKVTRNSQVTGVIVQIGEDAWKAFKPTTEHAGLKIGDRVYFARYAGKWIIDPETNDEYLVLNDEDIVAKCR